MKHRDKRITKCLLKHKDRIVIRDIGFTEDAYHGTRPEFSESLQSSQFRVSERGLLGQAVYFYLDDYRHCFWFQWETRRVANPAVFRCRVNMKNTLDYNRLEPLISELAALRSNAQTSRSEKCQFAQWFIELLRQAGYKFDCTVWKTRVRHQRQYRNVRILAVYKPSRIKCKWIHNTMQTATQRG